MESPDDKTAVLIVGSGKLVTSVAACLLLAGHRVIACTAKSEVLKEGVEVNLTDSGKTELVAELQVTKQLPDSGDFGLAVVLGSEDPEEKRSVIGQLESRYAADLVIAVSSESIPLSDLQSGSRAPERIMIANWVEPAHTTFFLELVVNTITSQSAIDYVSNLAKNHWRKDPYVIEGELGVRSRMMSALVREAFFLIQEGYATVEDVDRACRNDPGYYFPFAGNYRYMDLMGTYAYGMVMKDLNPELATQTKLPEFFTQLINEGKNGMESNSGFYDYKKDEVENWNKLIRTFSHEIKEVIEKYPFNYK